jgi:hypothetical protein
VTIRLVAVRSNAGSGIAAGMTELPTPSSPLQAAGSLSGTELARLDAEMAIHAANRHKAVRVVAASSLDAADCRTLLAMLGLGTEDVRAAVAAHRSGMVASPGHSTAA